MKFIELITPFKNKATAEQMVAAELPNVEFDQIDTYLINSLDVECEVKFFDAETIPNKAVIEIDGIVYINLFPLSMLQEMIEDYSNVSAPSFTNLEIAKRIIAYRVHDA